MTESPMAPTPTPRSGARLLPWLIAGVLLAALGLQQLSRDHAAATTFAPNPEHQVILLSTRWCGYCARMRAFLERNGVAYEDWDVEHTARGSRAWARFGRAGVPILLVDGKPVFGFDPRAVAQALARPRAPSAPPS